MIEMNETEKPECFGTFPKEAMPYSQLKEKGCLGCEYWYLNMEGCLYNSWFKKSPAGGTSFEKINSGGEQNERICDFT